jgi:hypothetical protein
MNFSQNRVASAIHPSAAVPIPGPKPCDLRLADATFRCTRWYKFGTKTAPEKLRDSSAHKYLKIDSSLVAGERRRLSPRDANLRYFLRPSA